MKHTYSTVSEEDYLELAPWILNLAFCETALRRLPLISEVIDLEVIAGYEIFYRGNILMVVYFMNGVFPEAPAYDRVVLIVRLDGQLKKLALHFPERCRFKKIRYRLSLNVL